MIPDEETWINENMLKFSNKIVEEFMDQYKVDEPEARRSLAQYYYFNYFDFAKDVIISQRI